MATSVHGPFWLPVVDDWQIVRWNLLLMEGERKAVAGRDAAARLIAIPGNATIVLCWLYLALARCLVCSQVKMCLVLAKNVSTYMWIVL
jgi:hypothetical protein